MTLPAARPVASVRAPASDYPDLALDCALEELGEVSVRRVAAKDVGAFRRLLHTHHPLGWDRSPGTALNCWIVSSRQGRLGGVRWSAAGWHQACRDRWIGWSEAARVAHLQAVVRQSRFLILPGVRVPNLASHVLAKASKVLAAEWRRAHGTAPMSQTQLHASIVNITPLLSNVSNCKDTVIEVVPRQRTLTRLRRRNPGAAFGPHRLRLVRYAVGDTVFILGTTLLDRDRYSIDQLSDLYHARWGIEERYKVSKQLMEIEDFHGQSERGVKQERYACFTLIAMTRLFANHGEDHLNGGLPNDGKPPMQTNFKHGLAAVAANIESLLLQHASALRETVARIVGEIVRCRQRLRPGRSYERRSRKPIGKWQRGRRTPATTAR